MNHPPKNIFKIKKNYSSEESRYLHLFPSFDWHDISIFNHSVNRFPEIHFQTFPPAIASDRNQTKKQAIR